MQLKPCLVCGELSRESRCERHVVNRGSSGKQATFRRRTLRATGGRCAACGSADRVEAHHLRPLAAGGTDADGGVALCWRCHLLAHGQSRGAAILPRSK
jgi:hypothetical protein